MENNIEKRLSDMEKAYTYLDLRIAAIEMALRKTIGLTPVPVVPDPSKARKKPGSKKMSDDEKQELREQLKAGLPYTKEALAELGRTKQIILGSILGVRGFGLKGEQLLDALLEAQPKPKKGNGKKGDKKK